MKKLFLIFIFCLLFASLSFGQKKVVTHHTDLIDSPTSYVIEFGTVGFSMRFYPCPHAHEETTFVNDTPFIQKVDDWKGNGLLIKIRTTPVKNLSLGLSIKEDGLISCGSPPTPKIEDIGILLKYRLIEEPISWAMGIDVIEYERWERRRGFYTVLGANYKNTIFPYLGGSVFYKEKPFGAAFGGAEIIPWENLSAIFDWSWISGKGNFFDFGVRARFAERWWVEFDLRDIEDVIRGGEEWNRMVRIWYTWTLPPSLIR